MKRGFSFSKRRRGGGSYKPNMKTRPILYLVVPCYNEEAVLPITAPMFLEVINQLISTKEISDESRILFVNDGSYDSTWSIISDFSHEDEHYIGISQSRNRGHQNAVFAGLMEAKELCDITISIDCDGQDDINAISAMVAEYKKGNEIVYGVRRSRKKDSFFKRFTAESFYKLMGFMGVETVFNHADYRLISSRVLDELEKFHEVNLFLRGMVPLIGFPSTKVYYDRNERFGGESHYPLSKMLALAFNGITSMSIRPIRMVAIIGAFFLMVSNIGLVYMIIHYALEKTISGWLILFCAVFFMGGVQLISVGIIGEYIGKTYLETKARPRYIISERTFR